MPTPKTEIKYSLKPGTTPQIMRATILDAGFRRRVDQATKEVIDSYISIALITEKGTSETVRMHLNGGAKAITKRTLEQLQANFGRDEKDPLKRAQIFADSLAGKEVIISKAEQIAVDKRDGSAALDDQDKPIVAQPNVNIRTNDFEAGADVLADLDAEDPTE